MKQISKRSAAGPWLGASSRPDAPHGDRCIRLARANRLCADSSYAGFYGFFIRSIAVCTHFLHRPLENQTHVLMQGVVDGVRMDWRHGGAVGCNRRSRGPAGEVRPGKGRASMIGMEVLYGLGALVAIILLAYLVYTLICAEEF